VTAGAHQALAAWWRDTGEQITPSADALARVRDIESRYGLSLPEDFRTYLLETAPAEDLWDSEGVTWWSADRIKNMPDEYATFNQAVSESEITGKPETWLFFADYLIWCWAWAICCSDGEDRGKIAVIGGPEQIVAASFSDFVERYLRDPVAMSVAETSEETASRHRAGSGRPVFSRPLVAFFAVMLGLIALFAMLARK
jgi:hypothetical protein